MSCWDACLLACNREDYAAMCGPHYAELVFCDGCDGSGCHDRAAAVRARAYAKRRGWLPPLALDDDRLDDPTYKAGSPISDTTTNGLDETAIYRRTHGDKTVRLTKGEAAELVRRWTNSGRSLAECQRVTGLNPHRFLRDQQEAS